MKLAVDVKNLSLYTGGISSFFYPLLLEWVKERPSIEFYLIGPDFDSSNFEIFPNVNLVKVKWPKYLPRFLRHPFYDNWIFPRSLKKLKVDFVFTPYHDVLLPKNTRSAMMIHDTCINDLADSYPFKIRAYYQYMLRTNLKRVNSVITVSESSRDSILKKFNINDSKLYIVNNALDQLFLKKLENETDEVVKKREKESPGLQILYTGGNEYRKNIMNLLKAVDILASKGCNPRIWITGKRNAAWERILKNFSKEFVERIEFTGYVNLRELRLNYLASDVVVYPTFCEGFGRVCLEAMSLGVPIACSDIPVLREIGGDYPDYFNPKDPLKMSYAILKASEAGFKSPVTDERYKMNFVKKQFLYVMDSIVGKELN